MCISFILILLEQDLDIYLASKASYWLACTAFVLISDIITVLRDMLFPYWILISNAVGFDMSYPNSERTELDSMFLE